MSDDRKIAIDPDLLKNLFDLAVNSLNFGSGFWDHDDTIAARNVARLLGIDPMVGTPHKHKPNFLHPFVPRGKGDLYCLTCDQLREDGKHEEESA